MSKMLNRPDLLLTISQSSVRMQFSARGREGVSHLKLTIKRNGVYEEYEVNTQIVWMSITCLL